MAELKGGSQGRSGTGNRTHASFLGLSLRAVRKACLLTPLVALLAACAGRGEIDRFSAVRDVSPREAFVIPPTGGPAIVGVLEQRYANGVEQEVILAGGGSALGENKLTVQFLGPVDRSTSGRQTLSERSLATTNLAREIRAAMPGVPMRQSSLYVQNRYGPFGYAVGRVGQTTCIYAWQRMSGTDNATLLLRPRGIINLRLRLCQANATEEQLLFSMYGLSINAFLNNFAWVPYDAPRSPSADLGRSGAPVYPVAASGFENVIAPAPVVEESPRPRPRRRAPRPAPTPVVQAPLAPLPAPVGPAVPPPPSAGLQTTPSAATAPAAVTAGAVPPPPASAQTATAPSGPIVAPPEVCSSGSIKVDGTC